MVNVLSSTTQMFLHLHVRMLPILKGGGGWNWKGGGGQKIPKGRAVIDTGGIDGSLAKP